jgi:hypothetical protein
MNITEWYYIEVGATVGVSGTNATTIYELRVNNQVLNQGTHTSTDGFTGTATRNYCDVRLFGPGGGEAALHDDVYITDGEFLGDTRVYVMRPDGDHATTDWTQGGTSTGTNDYNFINDQTPNDGTGYLLATASGNTEFTEMQDISGFTGSIKGAQPLWCMSKSDGGPGVFDGLLLDGTGTGGTHTSSTWYPSYASFLYFHKAYSTSPFTGSAWTEAELDAIKQGERRVA